MSPLNVSVSVSALGFRRSVLCVGSLLWQVVKGENFPILAAYYSKTAKAAKMPVFFR